MNTKTPPRYLETNDDIRQWEEFLNSIPQEDLVGFILDRMLMDNKFFGIVESRFLRNNFSLSLKDILKAYDNEVYFQFDKKQIDTEFVVAITRNFMRAIDEIHFEEERKKGYAHIVDTIKIGYHEFGLGWPDDDDIIDDILQELGSSIELITKD